MSARMLGGTENAAQDRLAWPNGSAAETVARLRSHSRWNDWRWQCAQADALGAQFVTGRGPARAALAFPVRVTPYYAALIDFCNPADPLARQVVPDVRETRPPGGRDQTDPFGECHETAGIPGLAHRFPDRVLLRFEAPCAVHCRHCTRRGILRNIPGFRVDAHLSRALDYLRAHPEVREVIFSGGDPLHLTDINLLPAVAAVAALPSIDALRIGTRMPVAAPMRVTPDLARELGVFKKIWVNTQFNHPRELTELAIEACSRLVEAGIPVSNQCVILRGVNDDADTLRELFARLQRHRIRPYYAFLGDPVAGTAHLRVTPARLRVLEQQLETRLGGLALPRFVADVPGAAAKIPVWRLTRRPCR